MSRQAFGAKPWEPPRENLAVDPNGPGNPRSQSASRGRPSPSPTGGSRNRSSSPSPMLAAIGLAQPTIKLSLKEEILFLHPDTEGNPTDDPFVAGSVTIWLPKKKAIRGLSVKLVGRMDIGWPDGRPYESSLTLDKEVNLFQDDVDTVLEKGEHTFEFSIIVPSNTASYERCTHGRVRHTVVARAKGLGKLGGDVVCDEKFLFLIVNPNGAGESQPPPPLYYKMEGSGDDIGPYTLSVQSQHIMVGGLILFRFNLISPPHDVMIYSIKVKINQHFKLQSFLDRSFTLDPPTDVRTVFVINNQTPANYGVVHDISGRRSGSATPAHGPFKIVKTGEDFKVHHLARLLNDNSLRPTTLEGTDSGIKLKHEIAVEVTYKILEGDETDISKDKGKGKDKEPIKDRKKLVITKPLEIFSCCCFLDSLTLPVYSLHDPHPLPDTYSPPCVCGMAMEAVMKHHGDTLLREEGEQGLTYAPILKSSEQRSGSSTPLLTPPVSRGRQGAGGSEFFRADSLDRFLRTDSSDRLAGLTERLQEL